MVGQTGMPGNEEGGGNPQPTGGSLQPPVFEPPLSLPGIPVCPTISSSLPLDALSAPRPDIGPDTDPSTKSPRRS